MFQVGQRPAHLVHHVQIHQQNRDDDRQDEHQQTDKEDFGIDFSQLHSHAFRMNQCGSRLSVQRGKRKFLKNIAGHVLSVVAPYQVSNLILCQLLFPQVDVGIDYISLGIQECGSRKILFGFVIPTVLKNQVSAFLQLIPGTDALNAVIYIRINLGNVTQGIFVVFFVGFAAAVIDDFGILVQNLQVPGLAECLGHRNPVVLLFFQNIGVIRNIIGFRHYHNPARKEIVHPVENSGKSHDHQKQKDKTLHENHVQASLFTFQFLHR